MPRLFALMPHGLGTSDIEAFGCYFSRLAARHSMSTRGVLSWVAADSGISRATLRNGVGMARLPDLVRPNRTTEIVVRLVSDATGISRGIIESTTFLALSPILVRSAGAFSDAFRWCPACVAERVAEGRDAYFKLKWHLHGVTRCDIHRIPLVTRCLSCCRTQNSRRAREDCSRCVFCNALLVVRPAAGDIRPSWEMEGADLVNLVGHIASHPGVRFNAEGVEASLGWLSKIFCAPSPKAGPLAMLPKDERAPFRIREAPNTLVSIRRVGYRASIPLPILLDGDASAITRQLDLRWNTHTPPGLEPRPKKLLPQRPLLKAQIKAFLKRTSGNVPPSLRAAARELRVSTGGLLYHFPDDCREMITAYVKWKATERKGAANAARKAVMAYLREHLDQRPEPPSRKGAVRALRAKTQLSKRLLVRTVESAIV